MQATRRFPHESFRDPSKLRYCTAQAALGLMDWPPAVAGAPLAAIGLAVCSKTELYGRILRPGKVPIRLSNLKPQVNGLDYPVDT